MTYTHIEKKGQPCLRWLHPSQPSLTVPPSASLPQHMATVLTKWQLSCQVSRVTPNSSIRMCQLYKVHTFHLEGMANFSWCGSFSPLPHTWFWSRLNLGKFCALDWFTPVVFFGLEMEKNMVHSKFEGCITLRKEKTKERSRIFFSYKLLCFHSLCFPSSLFFHGSALSNISLSSFFS